MSDVARILDRVQQGDLQAAEALLTLVGEEPRGVARSSGNRYGSKP